MFKFRLPFCVRGECVARMRFPLCLDREHFPGVVKNGSRRFYFGAGPSPVAERAERRRFFSCANVAGNQVCLLEWNVELGFICELENQYFLLFMLVGTDRRGVLSKGRRRARRSCPTKFLQAQKSPDAMLEVHNKVVLV